MSNLPAAGSGSCCKYIAHLEVDYSPLFVPSTSELTRPLLTRPLLGKRPLRQGGHGRDAAA